MFCADTSEPEKKEYPAYNFRVVFTDILFGRNRDFLGYWKLYQIWPRTRPAPADTPMVHVHSKLDFD